MSILGVKCFYSPLPFITLFVIHMEVFVINLLPELYFQQCSDLFTYIQEQFGTSFQTQWYHPPRFLPCWHDKRGQSLIPELCYEGDSGVNAGWRATQERNVWTSAGSKGADRKRRAAQQQKLTSMIYGGRLIVCDNHTTRKLLCIIVLWMSSNSGVSQLPDSFIQRNWSITFNSLQLVALCWTRKKVFILESIIKNISTLQIADYCTCKTVKHSAGKQTCPLSARR